MATRGSHGEYTHSAMIGPMPREYLSLRRRTFFAPLWGFAVVVALGLLSLAVHRLYVDRYPTTLVIVMRHAEKQLDAGADPELSAQGLERASKLAMSFQGPGHLGGIDAVFITQWRRSGATVAPLVAAARVPVERVQDGDIDGLVRRIDGDYVGRRVLVIAHSDTVPQIVKALAGGEDVPPIGASEYGTTYVIAKPRFGRANVLRMTLP
jgi:phosphohistidine phosphatase SixA